MADPITRAQIRGARAMLDWSMITLADTARISVAAVKRAEDEKAPPISAELAGQIRDALETEGIRFLSDDSSGPGLRLTPVIRAAPKRHHRR